MRGLAILLVILIILNASIALDNNQALCEGGGYNWIKDSYYLNKTSDYSGTWWTSSMSSDGSTIIFGSYYQALLILSTNNGLSWSQIIPGSDYGYWQTTSMSSDGNIIFAGSDRRAYISINKGSSWSEITYLGGSWSVPRYFSGSAMSSDGSRIIMGQNQYLWLSTNSGSSWNNVGPILSGDVWQTISMSSDGSIIIAATSSKRVYRSTDYGSSWSETRPSGNYDRWWKTSSMSSDGSKIIICHSSDCYLSTSSGSSWSLINVGPWGVDPYGSAMSSDGNIISVMTFNRIYLSRDGGVSWTSAYFLPGSDWRTSSMNDNGDSIIVGDGSSIYFIKKRDYASCCGNDGINDNFYNGSLSETTHFCYQGTYINQAINDNQAICEYYDYKWFTGTITGIYPRCCGNDGWYDTFNNGTHYCFEGTFYDDLDDSKTVCEGVGYTWFTSHFPQSFSMLEACVSAESINYILSADFDNDGDDDIIFMKSNYVIYLLENDGTPFIDSWPLTYVGETYAASQSFSVADLDNDGYLDVTAGDFLYMFAWKNDGTPFDSAWTRTTVHTYSGNNGINSVQNIATADFDNDGFIDIASLGYMSGSPNIYYLNIFENDGTPFNGVWVKHNQTITEQKRKIKAGDLNNDGLIDLITSGDQLGSIMVYENDGTLFTNPWLSNTVVTSVSNIGKLEIADMDNDGYIDIITSEGFVSSIILVRAWKNDATPFSETWTSNNLIIKDFSPGTGGMITSALGIADFDGDGWLDIAFEYFRGGISELNLSIAQNDKTPFSGTLTEKRILGTEQGTTGTLPITFSKLGSSKTLSMIAGNSVNGKIIIFYNESIIGNNNPCCGDDGVLDIFHNKTHSCYEGIFYPEFNIDEMKVFCELEGYTWINNSIGDYESCCGDDGINDNFGNASVGCYQGTITYNKNLVKDFCTLSGNEWIEGTIEGNITTGSCCNDDNHDLINGLLIDLNLNSWTSGYCVPGYSNWCDWTLINTPSYYSWSGMGVGCSRDYGNPACFTSGKYGNAMQVTDRPWSKSNSTDGRIVPSMFAKGPFSINVWVKNPSTGEGWILGESHIDSSERFGFGKPNGVDDLLIDMKGLLTTTLSVPSFSDNQWHMLTLVYDNVSSIKAYIDGVYGSSATVPAGGSTANPNSLVLGARSNTGYYEYWWGNDMPGYIDEFRIYNRTLNENEIRYLYLSNNYSGSIDYFYNTTTMCNYGVLTTNHDVNQGFCQYAGYTWFTGNIGGNTTMQRCCGDDGVTDNFYNGTVGTATLFCVNGSVITGTTLDKDQILCENYGYDWINPRISEQEIRPAGDVSQSWISSGISSNGNVTLSIAFSGDVYYSVDNRGTWLPAGLSKYWRSSDISYDGKVVIAGESPNIQGGRLYLSSNSGMSWNEVRPDGDANRNWYVTSINNDGSVILAGSAGWGSYPGRLWLSNNSGTSWSEVRPAGDYNHEWYVSSMNSDGDIIIVGIYEQGYHDGYLHVSTDQGNSWNQINELGFRRWKTTSMSSDGSVIIAGSDYSNGRLFLSNNTGASWYEIYPPGGTPVDKNWGTTSMSSDGSVIIAGVYGGRLYLSTNTGASWSEIRPAGDNNFGWYTSSMNSDGSVIIAGVYVGRLYLITQTGGFNYNCCGDDGVNDYFNNNSVTCYSGVYKVDGDYSESLCINEGYSWINNGIYLSPFCFDDQTPGPVTGWNYVNITDTSFTIIDSLDGQNLVLNITDNSESNTMANTNINKSATSGVERGIIKFKYYSSNPNKQFNIQTTGTPGYGIWVNGPSIMFNNSGIYNNVGTPTLIYSGINPNTWYDITVAFNMCGGSNYGTYNLYINNTLIKSNIATTTNSVTCGYRHQSYVKMYTGTLDFGFNTYIDDIELSWSYNNITSCCGDDGINDNFNNGTNYCYLGDSYDDLDSNQLICEGFGFTWFTGEIQSGSNFPCCGDDGINDLFHNATDGYGGFCFQGEYSFGSADESQGICEYLGYTWMSGAAGTYTKCCGNNGPLDDFGNNTNKCCCNGIAVSDGEYCDLDGDGNIDSQCSNGNLPSVYITTSTLNETYIVNDYRPEFLLRNTSNETITITESVITSNTLNCAPSSNNPTTINPGLIGLFEYNCGNFRCEDMDMEHEVKLNLTYQGTSGEKESIIRTLNLRVRSPLDITSISPQITSTLAAPLNEQQSVLITLKNLGSETIKYNTTVITENGLIILIENPQKRYTINELRDEEFTLLPGAAEVYRLRVIPTSEGDKQIQTLFIDTGYCTNITDTYTFTVKGFIKSTGFFTITQVSSWDWITAILLITIPAAYLYKKTKK